MDIVQRLKAHPMVAGTVTQQFHAMIEQRHEAAETIMHMRAALLAVEEWWLSDGMNHFDGAPYAIFAARAAIAKSTT